MTCVEKGTLIFGNHKVKKIGIKQTVFSLLGENHNIVTSVPLGKFVNFSIKIIQPGDCFQEMGKMPFINFQKYLWGTSNWKKKLTMYHFISGYLQF